MSTKVNKFGLSTGPRFDSGRNPVNSIQCGSEPINLQARVLNYCFQQQKPSKSKFAIWLLSPQRFHSYFYLNIVAWQYQKYSTILILVLCLLCVAPLSCSSYSSVAPSDGLHLSSAADNKMIVSYLHIHLFSNVLHRRRRISPRRPMYLLIVGSHYCVMRFAYAFHMATRILSFFPACILSLSSLL